MPITSILHWDVYKEKVSQAEDKSLELFATKVEAPRFAIDFNRLVSSPMIERRSVPFVENRIGVDASNAYSLPPTNQENEDSNDEGPREELDEDGSAKEENQIRFELTGLEKRTCVLRDLSLAHKAVVDSGMRNTAIEPTPCPDLSEPRDEDEDENAYLKKGVKFLTLDDMKVWLSDYAIRNHMPFYVEHSDINLRFTVKCDKGDEG
ncbi:hypothetical protein D1007_61387 [Hordeum vulgare]|nr:hypothetical protein D1007_61387 [Hordeum vulgare]